MPWSQAAATHRDSDELHARAMAVCWASPHPEQHSGKVGFCGGPPPPLQGDQESKPRSEETDTPPCSCLRLLLNFLPLHQWPGSQKPKRHCSASGLDTSPLQSVFRPLTKNSASSLRTACSILTFSLPINLQEPSRAMAMWFCSREDRRWVLSSLETYFHFFPVIYCSSFGTRRTYFGHEFLCGCYMGN